MCAYVSCVYISSAATIRLSSDMRYASVRLSCRWRLDGCACDVMRDDRCDDGVGGLEVLDGDTAFDGLRSMPSDDSVSSMICSRLFDM